MSYIIENLYMGSECDAYDGKYLKMKFGVNHLLTIDSKPLTLEAKEGFTYKHVYALDDIDTDLLTKLEECNQFIDEGRQSGGILVHWPNSGFLQQLRLFECMGNSVDAKSTIYKAYKLEKLAQQFKNGE
ncbi:hypothetical protein LSH36_1222g00009 [Paralvinella palmiformis]|uniref:protein-tyrosine-phosphatase n=1 Tax=Paralvinella palmiformis TaxID=53620 RepID=A0AAD9IUL0_9ANNE|nr:hypothetical protein LSH36_1222g00009 [Paralvinella palmiformis]